MKRMKLTTAGRVVIFVIVLALLAGIGGFGYNYYKNNIADDKPISSGTQSGSTSQKPTTKPSAGKTDTSDPVINLSLDEWVGWKPIIDANQGLTTQPGSIFDQLGIKVNINIINDATASSNALITGELNAAGYTTNRTAFLSGKFQEAGLDVVMPVFTNYSAGGDGIIAKSGINTVNDLLGKKIGVPRFSEAQTLVAWFVNKSDLSDADKQSIIDNMILFDDASETGEAFFAGQLDVAATWQPYLSYLNNANGEEDVKNGNELATLYGIRIVPPRFGLSKDKYLLNIEEKVIAKGISSVKYMNADVANELYELAKAGKPKSFMDLLMQLDEKTHLDTRQRDILVKIDYFAEYGNSKELLRMVDFFSFFKNGTMKKISKDKVTVELEPIIAQYATDKSKSGQPAKSYTFTDLPGLLRHLEVMVRDMHIQDFDLKSKMQIQLENLGYIDLTTNKKEDQRKLVILDIYPLRSKKTKEIWAYALQVRSIGTGKTNRWTIYSELYDRKPLQRYDTIYVPMNGWGERRGYLYLYNYDYVI